MMNVTETLDTANLDRIASTRTHLENLLRDVREKMAHYHGDKSTSLFRSLLSREEVLEKKLEASEHVEHAFHVARFLHENNQALGANSMLNLMDFLQREYRL